MISCGWIESLTIDLTPKTMNCKHLFEIALGDIRPWHIENIEFKQLGEKVRELHIYLDFAHCSEFSDSYGIFAKHTIQKSTLDNI